MMFIKDKRQKSDYLQLCHRMVCNGQQNYRLRHSLLGNLTVLCKPMCFIKKDSQGLNGWWNYFFLPTKILLNQETSSHM